MVIDPDLFVKCRGSWYKSPGHGFVLAQEIMSNQVPAVICVSCEEPIFFCKAVGRDYIGGKLKAEDFVPLCSSDPPEDGDDMLCPRCGKQFALTNGKGGVILKLEGDSWWPHPPI